MNTLINTKCINNDKPLECYKVVGLAGDRREFVFLYRRSLRVGTVVSIFARYHDVHKPIVQEVTGSKKRKDGLYDIFVMVRGKG